YWVHNLVPIVSKIRTNIATAMFYSTTYTKWKWLSLTFLKPKKGIRLFPAGDMVLRKKVGQRLGFEMTLWGKLLMAKMGQNAVEGAKKGQKKSGLS
ncbi:hypothetical protein Q604_UNBc4C00049G0001, partial [human gut metagenome]